jgi:aminoglycoside phosphotransferase (APT) family kinase protein
VTPCAGWSPARHPDRLPRQLVHFDFRSANLLCAGREVAAILDLEEAQHEHRLVELARATVLLGTRYHNWGPVPAEVRAEFHKRSATIEVMAGDETILGEAAKASLSFGDTSPFDAVESH